MTTRTVELSLSSLGDLPWEMMLLAGIYTVAPLLTALAILFGAQRIAAALLQPEEVPHNWKATEPKMAPAKKSTQDAAYEAVRDWYAEVGTPTAQACYTMLSSITGRNN